MGKKHTIQAVIVRVGQEPKATRVARTSGALSKLVGGDPVVVPLAPGVNLVCCEDGLPRGMEMNAQTIHGPIVGDFVLVGGGENGLASLPRKRVDLLCEEFALEGGKRLDPMKRYEMRIRSYEHGGMSVIEQYLEVV